MFKVFFKKLKKIVEILFEDADNIRLDENRETLSPGPGAKTQKNARKEFPRHEIKDSDYWWCFEGHSKEDIPVFEEIDDEQVSEELNRKIDNDQFPVIEIPSNVMKTMKLLNHPNFDYTEISELIKHSPAMVGEFFKVINSSYFNRGVAINDIKVILPRLGRDNIKSLLYMYSSKMSFASHPLFNELAADIVNHSYAVATIASYLSQRYYPDPDGAFLAGLLHDIGKLGILRAISENFALPEEIDFEMCEEIFDNIFPGLYEKAGEFLAKNWSIDPTVICAIKHHNDFMNTDFSVYHDEKLSEHLCAVVNISDAMVRILGKGCRIEKVNIFELPAASVLSMEKDYDTLKFLDSIPLLLKPRIQDGEGEAE